MGDKCAVVITPTSITDMSLFFCHVQVFENNVFLKNKHKTRRMHLRFFTSQDLIGRQGIVTADKSFISAEDSKVRYPVEYTREHYIQGCIITSI